jgi:hypothetical protein
VERNSGIFRANRGKNPWQRNCSRTALLIKSRVGHGEQPGWRCAPPADRAAAARPRCRAGCTQRLSSGLASTVPLSAKLTRPASNAAFQSAAAGRARCIAHEGFGYGRILDLSERTRASSKTTTRPFSNGSSIAGRLASSNFTWRSDRRYEELQPAPTPLHRVRLAARHSGLCRSTRPATQNGWYSAGPALRPAELSSGGADQLPEKMGQMALVGEARRQGDRGQREIGTSQHFLGSFDAPAHEIVVGSA